MQKLTHHLRVQGVSGLVCHNVPDDRHAREGEIADEVEDLVPDELILVPEAFFVQHRIPGKGHGIVQGSPLGQAVRLQGFDVAQEPEGARIGHLAQERLFRRQVLEALLPEHGMVEIDEAGNARRVRRPDSDLLVAFAYEDGLNDLDNGLDGSGLIMAASLLSIYVAITYTYYNQLRLRCLHRAVKDAFRE